MPSVTLVHDVVPPSSNENRGVGGRGSPYLVAKTKGEWEGIFAILLIQAQVPRNLASVEVKPRLEFRTKIRRDSDNFMMPISKPLGDCLVKGGWLPDDTPDYYRMERVRIETGVTSLPARVKGRMTLELDYSTD